MQANRARRPCVTASANLPGYARFPSTLWTGRAVPARSLIMCRPGASRARGHPSWERTAAASSFAAWYGREGELVGVLAHGRDADYEEGKRRIEERAPWS